MDGQAFQGFMSDLDADVTVDPAPSRRSAETVRAAKAIAALPVRLRFALGARTLWSATRRLVRIAIPLERRALLPALPALPDDADGFLVTGLRDDQQEAFSDANQGLRVFVRARYPRSYASLQGSFDDYLAHFSAKTRSTLRRKQRKLAERSGGQLDLRSYHWPDQVEDFYRHARAVSAATYQERLLGAGLPEGEASLATMRDLAACGALRGWLLFLGGRPISYLYAPAEGDIVIYAYLGYDPEFADLSPGTVLQLEALRELMVERRFRMFDFTEGDGQHKRQFATGAVQCVDLLLLRPTLRNRALGYGLGLFDAGVATLKRLLPGSFLKLARAARR
jgi:CelD/BcsL family acetyltransferase involved in cellulose biosynthesis